MPLPAPPPPPVTSAVPVPPVVRPYEPPTERYGAGHRGVDLAAPGGSPVRSLTGGRVAFVGTVAGVPVVTVRLPDGRRVTYQPVRAAVAPGEPVDAGTVLGTVAAGMGGAGGHCADAGCLHVGLLRGSTYLDPGVLLEGAPAPVVLKPS